MTKKTTLVMYHGERVDLIGKITHLMRDRRGREYSYYGLRDVRFGWVYALNPDGSIKTRPEPQDPGKWAPTEKDELEYDAARLSVAKKRIDLKKAMQLRKPNPRILQAVALLRPFYLSMKDSDRRRFMGWVAEECSRKKGRK